MTEPEFVQATTRLERYFEKEYKPEQMKEMFKMLKEWSLSKYTRAINYCLRKCKMLPKLADFINSEVENRVTIEREKIKFVKCSKCNGEGFIKYFKTKKDGERILKYEYIALCTCQNAENQKQINGYKLPTLAELGMRGV